MITAIELTDDVVTLANAATGLSMTFTATRKVLPLFDQKELTGLTVTAAPRSDETEVYSRSDILHTFGVDVAVQKKIAAGENLDDQVEALAAFVSELRDYLRFKKPCESVGFSGIKIEPVYSLEHLIEHRLFTSVIKLEYKAVG